jgi:hypothetical protein
MRVFELAPSKPGAARLGGRDGQLQAQRYFRAARPLELRNVPRNPLLPQPVRRAQRRWPLAIALSSSNSVVVVDCSILTVKSTVK